MKYISYLFSLSIMLKARLPASSVTNLTDTRRGKHSQKDSAQDFCARQPYTVSLTILVAFGGLNSPKSPSDSYTKKTKHLTVVPTLPKVPLSIFSGQ